MEAALLKLLVSCGQFKCDWSLIQPFLQDMLLLVECVHNQAVVLLMRTLALALHSSWPMRLDTSENNNFSVVFRGYKIFAFSLGMQHDGANNACSNSKRIMAPSAGGQAENFLWSSCSAEYLQTFLRYIPYSSLVVHM